MVVKGSPTVSDGFLHVFSRICSENARRERMATWKSGRWKESQDVFNRHLNRCRITQHERDIRLLKKNYCCLLVCFYPAACIARETAPRDVTSKYSHPFPGSLLPISLSPVIHSLAVYYLFQFSLLQSSSPFIQVSPHPSPRITHDRPAMHPRDPVYLAPSRRPCLDP